MAKNGTKKLLINMLRAAMIAALYTALTLLTAPISFGLVQARIAEAMCVLPFLTPAAIPGLFIGCALSNLIGGFGLPDVIFGSLATLISALITYKIKNKWLAPLPAVLVNAAVIGGMLSVILEQPFWLTAAYIGAGQALSCYALGMPLLLTLSKYGKRLFN